MLIDRFPPLYKTVLNILSILGLIAGTISGCFTFMHYGLQSGLRYVFGLAGLAVGFLATYVAETVILTPIILFINFMINGSSFFSGKKSEQ